MTITTRVQLHCDIGLKCTKQIARTVEGPRGAYVIRHWAVANGWGTYGDRDACPDCWAELHSPTVREQAAIEGARDYLEDTQAGIDGERGG